MPSPRPPMPSTSASLNSACVRSSWARFHRRSSRLSSASEPETAPEFGDKVLRMRGNTLRQTLRATDSVRRWGGEESIAILDNVRDERTLLKIAERLRIMLECSRLDVGSESLAVTMSIGATLLHPGDTAESFVGRADQLMYQGKEAGRNRVTVG